MFRLNLRIVNLKILTRKIKMKKIILIYVLTIASLLQANDFRFYVDYASFYDQETPFVELYFMFPRQAMKWQRSGNKLQGKFFVAVNIYQEEQRVFAQTLAVEDVCSPGDTISVNDFIPELVSLHLSPGIYVLNTTVRDFYSGNTSERSMDLKVRAFDVSRLTVSDIEVASYVGRTQKKNKFTKLGMYDIVPLANPEFDEQNGIFYTYFEVYKLHAGEKYTCKSSIRDLNDKIVIENEAVETVAPGMFDIVIDYMDVRNLKSGIYDYHVSIYDEFSGQEVNARKRIYLTQDTDLDAFVYEEYTRLNTEKLDSMFSIFKPLMTQKEIKSYRESRLEGKQQVLIQFWKKRDTDMSTAINEYYFEMMERVQYANQHYTHFKDGIKTDRGRVLLKYGYPTEIQRSEFTGGTKSYEIWLYEGLRGEVKFVFCDIKGRGYLELIHSNMEGEVYNANWRAVIQAGAKDY